MSTTTPSADSANVPVKLEFTVTIEKKEKVETLADHRRVQDEAAKRLQAFTDAAGAGGKITGTLMIGKQKIKL